MKQEGVWESLSAAVAALWMVWVVFGSTGVEDIGLLIMT